MKKYIVKGINEKKVLEKVAYHFKIDVDSIDYEVLKKEKTIFGKVKHVELKIMIEEEKDKVKKLKEEKDIEIVNIEIEKKEIEEEIEEYEHEYCNFKILKSGIYLMVKEEFKENNADRKIIQDEIIKREVKNPISEKIEEALSTKLGEFVKIAEYSADYYKDAEVIIDISKDNMEAKVEITSPIRGNDIKIEKIKAGLQEKGIVYGINETAIKEIIDQKLYNISVLVAKGLKPINGNDAEIKSLLKNNEKVVIEDGEKIDFKNLNLIQNIEENTKVAEKIYQSNGVDGIDIFANEIKAIPGKEKKFSFGKNVIESEDGKYLLSKISGQVLIENGKFVVIPTYEVSEDVDYSTGNIDFIGTVHVSGNVKEGFTVKASGDIIVEGEVEDAILEAGGDIKISNGVLGHEHGKGKIKALNSIYAKFIQYIDVEAGNAVIVEDHILYSNVDANKKIIVYAGKGKIIGGKLSAGEIITAKIIGGKLGTSTSLEVGVLPEKRIRKRKLDEELKNLIKLKENIDLDVETLIKLKNVGPINDKLEKKLIEKTKEEFKLAIKIKEKNKEEDQLKVLFKNKISGKINVAEKVFQGTIIQISEHKLITRTMVEFTTFYLDKTTDEVGMLPYEMEEKK